MKALQSLILEHQVLSSVIDALESYALDIRQGRPVEPADLADFVAVFTEFAECIHHEKEESILLPLMVRHGSDWKSRTFATVRRDHRQEAYLIDVLRQAAERRFTDNAEDCRHVAAAALGLVDFQRNHHQLEHERLFPEVAQRLDAEALHSLQAALEKFDRAHDEQRAETIALARRLVQRHPRPTQSMVTTTLQSGSPVIASS